MKKFLSEFKEFALRGNVLDMAFGVVIGGAFGKITTSLVNDVFMPLVGMLIRRHRSGPAGYRTEARRYERRIKWLQRP